MIGNKWIASGMLLGWFFTVQHDMAGLPGVTVKSEIGIFKSQALCEAVREQIGDLEFMFTNFKLGKCTEQKDV